MVASRGASVVDGLGAEASWVDVLVAGEAYDDTHTLAERGSALTPVGHDTRGRLLWSIE